MNNAPQTIQIDNVEYIRKDSIKPSAAAEPVDGMKYVICRTYSAGVFAGYLADRNGKEVTLKRARRLWQWVGAASLSQAAEEGFTKPNDCKFPCEVSQVILTEAIEILACTAKAKTSIDSVPVWKA